MKKVLGKIVALVAVLAIGCCLVSSAISCKRSETETRDTEAQTKEQKAETAKRLQTEKLIQDLVTKHNAVADWDRGSHDYTIEVQDVLVRTDGRPIAFFAPVEDVIREVDEYSVHFSDPAMGRQLFLYFGPRYHFVLHCTQDHVNHIMQNPKQKIKDSFILAYMDGADRANYAVIAHISGVRKVNLELTAHTSASPSDDSFDVNVESTLEPSDTFVVAGRCLDLLFIGDYSPKNSQEAGSK